MSASEPSGDTDTWLQLKMVQEDKKLELEEQRLKVQKFSESSAAATIITVVVCTLITSATFSGRFDALSGRFDALSERLVEVVSGLNVLKCYVESKLGA